MGKTHGIYLSRRDFLLLSVLGCGGMTAAFSCGGLMTALILLPKDDAATAIPGITPSAMLVAPPTATPPPDYRYPNMILRSEWGAQAPNHAAVNENGFYSLENPAGWRWYQEALTEICHTVVFHHSVSYESDDLTTLLDIQQTHREERGWADIGYHYIIGKSGAVYEGRDIHVRGAHVEEYNTGSVGVCLLGDFMTEYPNDAQIGASIALVLWLAQQLQLSHLASHRDFAMTFCPGDTLLPYLDAFASNAGLARGTGGYVMPPEQIRATETAQASVCSCCGGSHTKL